MAIVLALLVAGKVCALAERHEHLRKDLRFAAALITGVEGCAVIYIDLEEDTANNRMEFEAAFQVARVEGSGQGSDGETAQVLDRSAMKPGARGVLLYC